MKGSGFIENQAHASMRSIFALRAQLVGFFLKLYLKTYPLYVNGKKSLEEICKSCFGTFHGKTAFVTVLHEFSAIVLMAGNLL